jgi:hypothetical protein
MIKLAPGPFQVAREFAASMSFGLSWPAQHAHFGPSIAPARGFPERTDPFGCPNRLAAPSAGEG